MLSPYLWTTAAVLCEPSVAGDGMFLSHTVAAFEVLKNAQW